MKHIKLILLYASLSIALNCFATNPTVATLEVLCNNGWVFDDTTPPAIEIRLAADGLSQGEIGVNVKQDIKEQYLNIKKLYDFDGGESLVKIALDLEPGFYTVEILHNGRPCQDFNIGYNPTKIISSNDAQQDFDEFWQDAKEELAQVEPKYKMVRIKSKSTQYRELYVVTMKSLGGATIQGHLAIPLDENRKYPAFINFMGYGAEPWIPSTDYPADRIDFVVSVRGQGLNKPNNIYGDWVINGLSSKEEYYYRGAFMDLIRSIDFIEQLPRVDTRNIFADGASQGGAFTLIAASLDKRLAAVAPSVPFLSDYIDYFKIVNWPGNTIKAEQHRLGLSDKQLYTTLSYFDVKNFTHMISCPVLMYVGLQDPVCPPHTNFSGYNHILTPKEYYISPKGTHNVEQEEWTPLKNSFFEQHTTK